MKRWLILLSAALLATGLATSPVSAAPGDPSVVVQAPSANAVFDSAAPVVASGTYRDDQGVTAVRILFYDTNTAKYLAPNGTWTAVWTPHLATLSRPGGTSGSYTYTWPGLPPGSYRIATNVIDNQRVATNVQRFITVTATPGPSPDAAFATVMFGRSGWEGAEQCVPYPNSVNLEQAVKWLHDELDIPAVGGVVTAYTSSAARNCQGYITYPTWDDLARLRDSYGAVFVSQSKTYGGWASATTTAAIREESCNTIGVFAAKGHDRAWAMFNYPNDGHTPAQEAIVSGCFAFGRLYGNPINARAAVLRPPYFVRTASVTSGKCNNPALPCYAIAVKNNRRYVLPDVAASFLRPGPRQYAVVQYYRFVSGVRLTGGDTNWDCTSSDARDHWVTTPEVYCFEDFKAALRLAGDGVTFTDPATVAEVWGRRPPG